MKTDYVLTPDEVVDALMAKHRNSETQELKSDDVEGFVDSLAADLPMELNADEFSRVAEEATVGVAIGLSSTSELSQSVFSSTLAHMDKICVASSAALEISRVDGARSPDLESEEMAMAAKAEKAEENGGGMNGILLGLGVSEEILPPCSQFLSPQTKAARPSLGMDASPTAISDLHDDTHSSQGVGGNDYATDILNRTAVPLSTPVAGIRTVRALREMGRLLHAPTGGHGDDKCATEVPISSSPLAPAQWAATRLEVLVRAQMLLKK